MKRLSNPFVRLSASLLVALALFTGVGCNEGSNVADNTAQRPAIAQQAVDHMKADWSHLPQFLQDAIAIQEANTASLMRVPGVIGTGVTQGADGRARVLVFTSRADVRGIPSSVAGLGTQIENVGNVVAMAGPPSKGYTGTYRNPLPCGVSIGNDDDCAAGTLGCLVRSVSGGNPYLLSNHHVLQGSNDGNRINQPGRYDSKNCGHPAQVATNYLIAPILFDGSDNYIDAGIATYNVTSYTGAMVNNLYTPTSTVTLPSNGLAVKKVGRTSGLTTSSIAGINVTINVSYEAGHVGHFVNQIYISNGKFIQSGDSGSLMVASSNNNPVGLCFAGSASACFANPITPVLNYFGVAVAQN